MKQIYKVADNSESPAKHSYAITPSDVADVGTSSQFQPRGIYVGGGGDITMTLEGDDTAVLFAAVPTGALLPLKAKRIFLTGTTATNIVAVY